MLGKKKNNGGMSLVEVIVSMLVLSIAAVTVMTAFSMAAKTNTSAKKQQSTEALLENFSEYTGAGGTNYKDWFNVSDANYELTYLPGVTPTPGVLPEKQFETLSNVEEGFFKYTVKITTDTKPAEYDTDELNKRGVIQFGGVGSNTILVDASNDDDTPFYQSYFDEHVAVVDEHNAAEEALFAANPSHVKDLWEKKTMADIYGLISREIWLAVVNLPGSDKMQLVAYKVYKVDSGLKLRDTTSREVQNLLYTSEEYDKGDSTEDTAKKLDQIYLLYPGKTLGTGGVTDVRIWDEENKLKTSLFIVKQVGESKSVTDVLGMADRFMPGEAIKISCTHPEPDPLAGSYAPAELKVYSSVNTVVDGGTPNLDRTLVAKGDEVRIIKVTIEIYDEAGTKLLAKKEITRLQ